MKFGSAPGTAAVEADVVAAKVTALRTANDMPEPGHVDVLRRVLRDPSGTGGSSWLWCGARRCWAGTSIAVLVLVTSLTVLPVTHWVAAVDRIVYRWVVEMRFTDLYANSI